MSERSEKQAAERAGQTAKYRVNDGTLELEGRLRFEVDSYEGPIEVEASQKCLKIRWSGEKEWQELDWIGLAKLSGSLNAVVRSNLDLERERGYNEGLMASYLELDAEEVNSAAIAERRALLHERFKNVKIMRPPTAPPTPPA